MNLKIIRPKNGTDFMFISITTNCETPTEQRKT